MKVDHLNVEKLTDMFIEWFNHLSHNKKCVSVSKNVLKVVTLEMCEEYKSNYLTSVSSLDSEDDVDIKSLPEGY